MHRVLSGAILSPIDRAVKYHLVMNMFYHPASVAKRHGTREAIREVVRYTDCLGAKVLHMGNDALADWWEDRLNSRVTVTERTEQRTRLHCECAHQAGMIVQLPARDGAAAVTGNDGAPLPFELRREFGTTWLFVIVPSGKTDVVAKLETAGGVPLQ